MVSSGNPMFTTRHRINAINTLIQHDSSITQQNIRPNKQVCLRGEKCPVMELGMRDFLNKCGGAAVIDGGFATELERHGVDLNDPLWSAKCLFTSPHLVRRVYLFFSLLLIFHGYGLSSYRSSASSIFIYLSIKLS